jgi:hypothetical protein
MKNIPTVDIKVFRCPCVEFKLFKINTEINLISMQMIKDKLDSNNLLTEPVEEWSKEFIHLYPFSTFESSEQLNISSPGLYLLEIVAGKKEYKSLISVYDFETEIIEKNNLLKIKINKQKNKEKVYYASVQEGRIVNEACLPAGEFFTTIFLYDKPIQILIISSKQFYIKDFQS